MTLSPSLHPDHSTSRPTSLGRAIAGGLATLAALLTLAAGPALAMDTASAARAAKAGHQAEIATLRSLLALQYPHLQGAVEAGTTTEVTGPEAGAAKVTTSPSL